MDTKDTHTVELRGYVYNPITRCWIGPEERMPAVQQDTAPADREEPYDVGHAPMGYIRKRIRLNGRVYVLEEQ